MLPISSWIVFWLKNLELLSVLHNAIFEACYLYKKHNKIP